jgi:hypothetical protein
MKKVRRFTASVEYRDAEGKNLEESFPVTVEDYATATALAESYVLQVMKLREFELRIVGA